MSPRPRYDKEEAESLMSTMGPRIRAARNQIGVTQRQLARRLGLSESFYARIEKGHALPSVGTLVKIVDVLGLSVDYLFGFTHYDPQPRIVKVVKEPPMIARIVDRAREDPLFRRTVVRLLKLCKARETEKP